MKFHYYQFPDDMPIREVALATKQDIEGRKDIIKVPDDVSNEDLENNFSRTVNCSRITTVKNLIKKYGGRGFTEHCERDGGVFEVTAIRVGGNNSTHKYNRHL